MGSNSKIASAKSFDEETIDDARVVGSLNALQLEALGSLGTIHEKYVGFTKIEGHYLTEEIEGVGLTTLKSWRPKFGITYNIKLYTNLALNPPLLS